jgi:hypothetical protein
MVDNIEQVKALVQEDTQITVIDITNKLDIICRSAYSINHKDLGYDKIWQGGCQSNSQMNTNRHTWKYACNFCCDIVNERLSCNGLSQGVHHYEPASKHQCMERKHTSLPKTKKLKNVPSASKVTLTLF